MSISSETIERHPYDRSPYSGAGNCRCGWPERSVIHPHPFTKSYVDSLRCVCAQVEDAAIHVGEDEFRSGPARPDPIDLIVELRTTLGLFAGAMPITPKQAWDEALKEVRRLTVYEALNMRRGQDDAGAVNDGRLLRSLPAPRDRGADGN